MINEEFFIRCSPGEPTIQVSRIRPIEDSLPVATWRQESDSDIRFARDFFRYPLEGCHGSPLEQDYPNRRSTP